MWMIHRKKQTNLDNNANNANNVNQADYRARNLTSYVFSLQDADYKGWLIFALQKFLWITV